MAELQAKLGRLYYRQTETEPDRPGRYRIEKDAIEIHTRPFRYPGHDFAALRFRLTVAGKKVKAIADSTGQRLPALFLEPERLGSVFSAELEDRTVIRLEDAPRSLVDAVLVTEDRDFYRHAGLSVRRLFGALFASLTRRPETGRLDADPAARQEPLPLSRAHGPPEGDRGGHGRHPRRPLLEGRDPRDVPERDLPRAPGRHRDHRRRRSRAVLLRQGGRGPRPRRVRHDRRNDPRAQRLLALSQPGRHAGAAQPHPPAHARGRPDRRGRPGRSLGPAAHAPHADRGADARRRTSSTSSRASSPSATARSSRPRACRSTRRSTSTSSSPDSER